MLMITSLDEIPDMAAPCGLTIGSFDGVHLGHLALFRHLRSQIPPGALLAVLTFSNHPSHYFTPNAPVPLIYPPLQKVKYLREAGVDLVILAPFDAKFSQTPYDQFLSALTQSLKCSHLVLGTGAVFGKGREGNERNVRGLAPKLGLEVDYFPKFLLDGTPVSSGRIRTLIAEAKFKEVEKCLGRPWSLMGVVHQGILPATGLCLPPGGTYPVRIKTTEGDHWGKARVSPQTHTLSLESPDTTLPFDNQDVEVFFSTIG